MTNLISRFISTSYIDDSVSFRKDEIVNTYEEDWDDKDIYFKINSEGMITKVNIKTGAVYIYNLDKTVH